MATKTAECDVVEHAILEYLEHYDFVHTAQCLQAEREHRQLTEKSGQRGSRSTKAQFLRALATGDEERLVALWKSRVPEKERDRFLARRLEFDLRVAIACFPLLQHGLHAGEGERATSNAKEELVILETRSRMSSLKRFMDGRGRALSNDPECCGLFALPHCENPREHPTFQRLLEPDHLAKLEVRLASFVDVCLKRSRLPALCGWSGGGQQIPTDDEDREPGDGKATVGGDGEQSGPPREANSRAEAYDAQLVKALYVLAADAVQALERVAREGGEEVGAYLGLQEVSALIKRLDSLRGLMDVADGVTRASTPAEDLQAAAAAAALTVDIEQSPGQQDWEQEWQAQPDPQQEQQEQQEQQHNQHTVDTERPPMEPRSPTALRAENAFQASVETPVLAGLNIGFLQADLRELVALAEKNDARAERQACLLLQALRWRISRTPAPAVREHVAQAYVDADLLAVRAAAGSGAEASATAGDCLLLLLLDAASPLIRDFTVRLVTFLASGRSGRNYLLGVRAALVQRLIGALEQGQWRFPTRTQDGGASENVLGCLQQLSVHALFCDAILARMESVTVLFTLLEDRGARSQFANEHLAALLLNLSLRNACVDKLDERRCLQSLEVLLASPEASVEHPYLVGALFSLLRSQRLRKEIIQSRGKHPDHVYILQQLVERGSPLEDAMRKQLAYIVALLDRGDEEIVAALALEDEKQEEADSLACASSPAQDDLAPEEDFDEPSDFRERDAHAGELQGEQLLVFAYLAERPDAATLPGALPEGGPSPAAPVAPAPAEGQRSPLMKRFAPVPDEMRSRPRLSESPR